VCDDTGAVTRYDGQRWTPDNDRCSLLPVSAANGGGAHRYTATTVIMNGLQTPRWNRSGSGTGSVWPPGRTGRCSRAIEASGHAW
jgi:hypothetical protein